LKKEEAKLRTSRQLLAIFALAGLPAVAQNAGSVFFAGTAETASSFLGTTNSSLHTVTTRCDGINALIPVGIIIHARNDVFFGNQVSGIQLMCKGLNDGMGDRFQENGGGLAGNFNDGSVPGSPYMRHCPTGQLLAGLTGRAGVNVDAVTIICAEANPDLATGMVAKGQTFTIGSAIWGSGGTSDSSTCSGNTFVRSVRVEFDNVVHRMRVNCAPLSNTILNGTDLTIVSLWPAPRNQRVAFTDTTSDGFSLAFTNLGRDLLEGDVNLRILFDPTRLAITGPSNCQVVNVGGQFTRQMTCPSPAIPRGTRLLIPGFQLRPLVRSSSLATLGSVMVDFFSGSIQSPIDVIFPTTLWP
jgi:hypothetical protein